MRMFQDGNNDNEYTSLLSHWKDESIEERMGNYFQLKSSERLVSEDRLPVFKEEECRQSWGFDDPMSYDSVIYLLRLFAKKYKDDQKLGVAVREYVNSLK